MFPFNWFPGVNLHDLDLDWVIKIVKELASKVSEMYTKWDQWVLDTTPLIKDTVNEWLNDHPEATTTVQDGSITPIKINDELWDRLNLDTKSVIREELSSGILLEYGLTDNDFYTVFSIPKAKFKMELKPINTDPSVAGTIREYVLRNKPYLAINISNTDDFICNGRLYGDNYTQTRHGSLYALKDDSVDFDIFEQGTDLSSLLALGYTNVMGGWNCLRENGFNKTIDWEYGTYANPNPRQTLAWDDDYWYVYTSYARFSLYGDTKTTNIYGKTMGEILAFCAARGWPTVCALDGGGSNYVAAGDPFKELSINVDNGYRRDCYMCIAFNEKEA